MAIEHLVLHDPEEVLHRGVVEAVALPGHRLPDASLFEFFTIEHHLVLPPLIAMEDEALKASAPVEGPLQHLGRLIEIRVPGYAVGDDLAIVHVQDRGQIQFAGGYVELGDVRRPFLVARSR